MLHSLSYWALLNKL